MFLLLSAAAFGGCYSWSSLSPSPPPSPALSPPPHSYEQQPVLQNSSNFPQGKNENMCLDIISLPFRLYRNGRELFLRSLTFADTSECWVTQTLRIIVAAVLPAAAAYWGNWGAFFPRFCGRKEWHSTTLTPRRWVFSQVMGGAAMGRGRGGGLTVQAHTTRLEHDRPHRWPHRLAVQLFSNFKNLTGLFCFNGGFFKNYGQSVSAELRKEQSNSVYWYGLTRTSEVQRKSVVILFQTGQLWLK